jgi:predicted anti-sigma-YlaC factor YlaD
MTCKEYEVQISQFIDRELQSSQVAGMFAHLGDCKGCQRFFQSALAINAAMIESPPIKMPKSIEGPGKALSQLRSRAYLWKKRIPVSVAALLLCLTLIGSLGITYLWPPKQQQAQVVIEPVVYMKLPTVEVRGSVEQTKSTVR